MRRHRVLLGRIVQTVNVAAFIESLTRYDGMQVGFCLGKVRILLALKWLQRFVTQESITNVDFTGQMMVVNHPVTNAALGESVCSRVWLLSESPLGPSMSTQPKTSPPGVQTVNVQ